MCCKNRLPVLTVDVGPPKLRAWMALADCMPRYLYYNDCRRRAWAWVLILRQQFACYVALVLLMHFYRWRHWACVLYWASGCPDSDKTMSKFWPFAWVLIWHQQTACRRALQCLCCNTCRWWPWARVLGACTGHAPPPPTPGACPASAWPTTSAPWSQIRVRYVFFILWYGDD
jgi:hypothetical protein